MAAEKKKKRAEDSLRCAAGGIGYGRHGALAADRTVDGGGSHVQRRDGHCHLQGRRLLYDLLDGRDLLCICDDHLLWHGRRGVVDDLRRLAEHDAWVGGGHLDLGHLRLEMLLLLLLLWELLLLLWELLLLLWELLLLLWEVLLLLLLLLLELVRLRLFMLDVLRRLGRLRDGRKGNGLGRERVGRRRRTSRL